MSDFIINNKDNIPKLEYNYGSKKIEQEGFLVYEYNPLRVFRTNTDIPYEDEYITTNIVDKVWYPEIIKNEYLTDGKETIYPKIGENSKYQYELDNPEVSTEGNIKINGKEFKRYIDKGIKYPKNSILDLDTKLLSFDLKHPVDILTQESYDGSVNLILNDNYNQPRLINTRFSPTGMNTYKVVDREGSNDTNIYDEESFNSDISLYKVANTIINLSFEGINNGGNLKVGNYYFYFKLADADGNETDFIAESGMVSCYIGNINDPFSIRGGIEDENSFKSVTFYLSNIDKAYNYINVYYTRTTSSLDGSQLTTAYKILNTYTISNTASRIYITGFEQVQEISLDEINFQYNLTTASKAQVSVQNMLFLGNIQKYKVNYKELTDLSLRFIPLLSRDKSIGYININYRDESDNDYKYEYYNPFNIYNRLGYWNNEIYRFGIVYILEDYSLSPVFNIRGRDLVDEDTKFVNYKHYDIKDDKGNRVYIPIDNNNFYLEGNVGENSEGVVRENSKGVIRILDNNFNLYGDEIKPIGLKFATESEVIDLLKDLGIKGFFFVRQPRIKTVICQALTIGLESVSGLPIIKDESGKFFIEGFFDEDRVLTSNFNDRKRMLTNTAFNGSAAICPEYELNQQYYNQFFTQSEFYISKFSSIKSISKEGLNYNYIPSKGTTANENIDVNSYQVCNITAVADAIKYIKGKNQMFSSEAGDAADATLFSRIVSELDTGDETLNIVRGDFGPYIGLEKNLIQDSIINIMIPGFNPSIYDEYFNIRFRDNSSFQAISNRYDINNLTSINLGENKSGYVIDNIYRGDCYIGNFTHRMCRNFQDSEAPNNDQIIDANTWKDHYRTGGSDDSEERAEINRGDVNAVQLGHWVTTKVCSSINLSLRCNDYSYPTEIGLTGHPRTFYPLTNISTKGNYKIPESSIHNSGYNKTLGDRYNFERPNVPAINDIYNTRILYSDIAINDAYKNGFRVFRGNNYQDYSSEYGSIIKMLDWGGNIICVFEHGVAVIPVNERAIAANGAGGDAYINTYKVLPENPNVLSSTYGSQWADSVIKTPYGIYGVDTVAKKIWKVGISGSLSPKFVLSVISDFKVQRFLNENITLNELELEPILGIRNVKTHYNAFKGDVMFTFYDDRNTLNEKAWNLCYNEILDKFITFYSWIPSFSENIDNIFFSFDRTASKNILIGSNSDYSDISIDKHNISEINDETNEYSIGDLSINIDTTLNVENITGISTKFELDNTLIKGFEIEDVITNNIITGGKLYISKWAYDQLYSRREKEAFRVPIIATVSYQTESAISQAEGSFTLTIEGCVYIYFNDFLKNRESTYFWKHGQAGLTKTEEPIKPCMWYGKQHPFEFEVVVVSNPMVHKMFTNLQLISNKVEPESLHFEITGEAYKFAYDKPNMYFRQEALKNLYQYYGADIVYNPDYLDIIPKQQGILYSSIMDRSTIFPLYYSRVDTINEIEDYYQQKLCNSKDYQMMSGSEILHDSVTNEFKIATHIKACPFESRYKQLIDSNLYNSLIGQNNYKPFLIKETEIYRVHKEPNDNYRIFDDILNGEYINTATEVYYKASPINDITNKSLKEFIQSFISEDDKNRNIFIYTFCKDVGLGSDNDTGDWFWIKEDKLEDKYIPRTKHYIIMEYNRLNGNMNYQEDKWLMQVPSINYVQNNENDYGSLPPLNIYYNPVPEDFDVEEFKEQLGIINRNTDETDLFPLTLSNKGYTYNPEDKQPKLQDDKWDSPIFETRIRDKYLKVRVRYTGNNLAIITALNTIFNISYA